MKNKGAEYIWFDGKFIEWEKALIPINTHALHYGTSVFEGIRAYSTGNDLFVFRLKDHMERLHRSARLYSISVKYSVEELCSATVELIKKASIKESCYIRPLTFVGLHGIDLNVTKDSPTHTTIIIFPFAKYFKGEGISACVSSWRRIDDESMPPMAKAAGNYLNSILATQESKRLGFEESILLDRIGNVSEASGENIFLVRNGMIYTPQVSDSILEGITRHTTISIAREMGYEIVERPIARSELYLAEEVFLTGTAAEIIAIIKIDGHTVGDGKEGLVTRGIRQKYEKVVFGKIAKYKEWLTPVW